MIVSYMNKISLLLAVLSTTAFNFQLCSNEYEQDQSATMTLNNSVESKKKKEKEKEKEKPAELADGHHVFLLFLNISRR